MKALTQLIALLSIAWAVSGCRAHDVRLENRTSHPLVRAHVVYGSLQWPRSDVMRGHDATYFYATVRVPRSVSIVWYSGGGEQVVEAEVPEAMGAGSSFGGTMVFTLRPDHTVVVSREPERVPGHGTFFKTGPPRAKWRSGKR